MKALWARRPARASGPTQAELEIDGRVVTWRRSARRRRSLALKLDRQGRLVAMTPEWVSAAELRRFVRSRADWIETQSARHTEVAERSAREAGRHVYLKGQRLRVVQLTAQRNFIDIAEEQLRVGSRRPPTAERLHRRLSQWLRSQAEEMLPQRLAALSAETGLDVSGWQVRAYTARWGSCRHDGTIQLNWKLVQAPPAVIDYVIVHELCHLRHFDHSRDFWRLVASHCPAYQQQRQWLKDHGKLLLATAY